MTSETTTIGAGSPSPSTPLLAGESDDERALRTIISHDVARAMMPQPGDRFVRGPGNEVLVTAVTRDGRVLHRVTTNGASWPDCAPLEEWARLARNTLDSRTEFIPANAPREAGAVAPSLHADVGQEVKP